MWLDGWGLWVLKVYGMQGWWSRGDWGLCSRGGGRDLRVVHICATSSPQDLHLPCAAVTTPRPP